MRPVLGVWALFDAKELNAMRVAIQEGAVRPTFEVSLLRSLGDAIVVRVVGADLPSRVRVAFYYVEGRGPFRLLRREDWPTLPDGEGPRIILTLGACAA